MQKHPCSPASWLCRFFPGSPRQSQAPPHRHQTKIRMTAAVLLMSAVCCQVFLAVRGSVEFHFLLPFPAGRRAGAPWQLCPACTPWSLSQPSCPEQTPRGGDKRLCPDLLSRSHSPHQRITSKALQPKMVWDPQGAMFGYDYKSWRFRAGRV